MWITLLDCTDRSLKSPPNVTITNTRQCYHNACNLIKRETETPQVNFPLQFVGIFKLFEIFIRFYTYRKLCLKFK